MSGSAEIQIDGRPYELRRLLLSRRDRRWIRRKHEHIERRIRQGTVTREFATELERAVTALLVRVVDAPSSALATLTLRERIAILRRAVDLGD